MKCPLFVISCALLALPIAAPLSAGPKDEGKPLNLEKLNTPADDVDPFPVDTTNLLYATNETGKFEVRLAKRSAPTTAWTPGKSFRPFLNSKDYDCRSPFMLRGATLFFAQNKIPDKKSEALRNFDLVHATAERAPLPLLGVSEREDEMFPSVAAGGREFYFSRKTKEGWNLFVAIGPGPGPTIGPIGKAQSVGFADGFHHASLTSTGLSMFLEGPLENGKTGLFRSKRASVGGKWSEPEPIKSLNTSDGKAGDGGPRLTADGSRLYFVSDRDGGKGGLDIWTILVKDIK